MKSRKKEALLLLMVHAFLFSGTAIANTLDMTYLKAFMYPQGFDENFMQDVMSDPAYYDKFNNCVHLSIDILNEMEDQERQKYSTCPNNPECTRIAKYIQTLTDIQLNVRNMERFISARRRNPQLSFVDSEIGRAALYLNQISSQTGIDLRRNPIFKQHIRTLGDMPCQ